MWDLTRLWHLFRYLKLTSLDAPQKTNILLHSLSDGRALKREPQHTEQLRASM